MARRLTGAGPDKDGGRARRVFLAGSAVAGAGWGWLACPSAWHGLLCHAADDTARRAGSAAATGLVYDEAYLRHRLSEGHLETPRRLRAIVEHLKSSGLDAKLRPVKNFPEPLPWIRTIHSQEHIDKVDQEAIHPDVCRRAVAGVLGAVDAVCQGEVRNAFCAVRPPGHHATSDGEYGFCFFNNVAIAARYAQKQHGLKRILIADWDYHHGNGTEWAFYEDPTVLFFSTHRLEAFPRTGWPDRTGRGAGVGYNINVPLPGGVGDKEILQAFQTHLVPAARRFRPELVLISAGFDSRHDDLLGDFEVSDEGFSRLTRLMMSLARESAGSRLISILEGGYNPDGLASAVAAHLTALLGD